MRGQEPSGLGDADEVDVGRVTQAKVPPAEAERVEVEVDDQRAAGSEAVAHPVERGGAERRFRVEQEAKGGDHVGGFRHQPGVDGHVPLHQARPRDAPSGDLQHGRADVDPDDLRGARRQVLEHAARPAGEVDRQARRGPPGEHLGEEALLQHPLQPSRRAGVPEVAVVPIRDLGVEVGLTIRSARMLGHGTA